ncbi:endonuclease III [Candidatus Uhrbacteria bacterium]|nr:endonuclease III [Candidatus Uhrbacteria bacterium]
MEALYVQCIIRILQKKYTEKGMVDMENPEHTLIATLLSARTTDIQVLNVYPGLRKAFPTLLDLARAKESDIATLISSIGLFRNKARAIKALAQMLLEEFDGKVPNTLEELIRLPGVGRKTASCVLWYGFGIPAMAVDTHVFRIAHRLGWVKGKTVEIVEQELMHMVPKDLWGEVNRIFVQFGRDICRPGKPQCWRCPVARWCGFSSKTPKP